jgi:hypothetical protein
MASAPASPSSKKWRTYNPLRPYPFPEAAQRAPRLREGYVKNIVPSNKEGERHFDKRRSPHSQLAL